MFNTLTTLQLEALLDQFSVPMFALDRLTPAGEFQLVCINATLEDLLHQARCDMIGKSVSELLPAHEADTAIRHHNLCATTQQKVRFSGQFTFGRRRLSWDTTLQYACAPEGHERLIGTTQPFPAHTDLCDRAAFEDIRYYASIADLHLQNMLTACDLVQHSDLPIRRAEMQATHLHGICRTVQSTVADIKRVVREAQKRHAGMAKYAPDQASVEPKGCKSMGTVTALSSVSSNHRQSVG